MLVEKSYTRITLALDIIRRINEGEYKGYHELNIIKHQVDLFDVISVKPSKHLSVSCNNLEIPVDARNLCWQSVEKIKQQFGIKENVSIHIEKNIPIKGGLAGGSSNAATVLQMLNIVWNLGLDKEQLSNIGRDIGMDIPFYFTGGTAFDTEATGILQPIKTELVFNFILATPFFGVSTSEAYKGIKYDTIGRNRNKTSRMKKAFETNEKDSVINAMHNDFNYTVFRDYPQLEHLKGKLLKAGCLNVVMSGSGSTLVGVVNSIDHAEFIKNRFNDECNTIIASTHQ